MAANNGKCLIFLCSGGGGNLHFAYLAIQNGWLSGWTRIIVISDRECAAENYAKRKGIEIVRLNFTESGQKSLIQIIESYSPSAIITTVHRILIDAIVSRFHGRIFNLHYSLLPSFGGKIGVAPVKAAMAHGVCIGGATVHAVTNELDGGAPLVQIAIPYSRQDPLENVMDLEFRSGCIALFVALRAIDQPITLDWTGTAIQLKGRVALLNPSVPLPRELEADKFWDSIKRAHFSNANGQQPSP